ncbi:hypothetical protein [Rhizobacter sp. Root16D2]|uniref:hypothetical protein n=1 Tax=Rhizobacter sp. Root16D2 TaxID=1736479 RepID=UPI0006F3CBC9|nr:hypothetical protein [Rhizobacter sp. Root16D2]KRB12490.1 hypothetical protein ASE08_28460 [Rhizobacter sp. Root16D2]
MPNIRLLAALIACGALCPLAVRADDDPVAPAAAELPSDESLEQSGAVIGEIRIDNLDIFDTRLDEEDNAVFRLANWLHIQTRRETIEQQLLFKPGERYSARLLRESERTLRANGYLRDAAIRVEAVHDGVVDIVVATQDVWTLKPGVSFGRKGGRNSSSVGIQETNLLGRGKQLGLDIHSGVDRRSKALTYQDNQLLGSHWTLTGEYDDNSDGRAQKLAIEKPFYALDTRSAGGLSLSNERRIDSVYSQGEVVNQYDVSARHATAYTGWSDGLHDGAALRWTIGLTFDEQRYAALPALGSASVAPDGRRLLYPWIGVGWIEDQFIATHNQDQIGKTEDIALGWNVRGRFGAASSRLGSDRTAGVFDAGFSKGWMPDSTQTWLLAVTAEGRVEREGLSGSLFKLSGRWYLRQSAQRTLFAGLSVDRGVRLDPDQQITLGGDTGLRGYPLRYQSGSGRWLATIEQRAYSDWFPFRLFHVGGAVFYDMGRTWDGVRPGDSAQGLLRDAGVGLRLGNSRSGLGTVVHVDAAFPMDGDKSIKKVQFIVEAKRSF